MANTLSPHVGDLLRRHRIAAGLTQEELAERAGVSVRAISDLERGSGHVPRRGTVQLLIDALELSEDEASRFQQAARHPGSAGEALTTREVAIQTFLVADLRGYTAFTHERGDEAAATLTRRFAAISREVVAVEGGEVIELRGDEVLVGFVSARGALRAAVALQERLVHETERDPAFPLRAGVGLDAGEAIPVEGGYRGDALNLAARLCALAGPGEVLASEGAIHLARVLEGIVYRDGGEVQLKGLPEPVRVIQVTREGVVPEARHRFRVQGTQAHALPLQPTPFIGRQREIDEVAALLRRDEVRLLTLTGPGGVGKTRLALRTADDVQDAFRDGVSFVSLASLTDPDLVPGTVAAALGIKDLSGEPILERLIEYLDGKGLLLILDNFEQLLPATDRVAQILAGCPHLTILVTSRAVLHLAAEHTYAVPPLAAPLSGQPLELSALSRYDAVQLFLQRAQAVKSSFQLTQENAAAIAEICARLDGLPLALELAAARTRLFSPPALLARLAGRLALLTGGARDTAPRHQTLRRAIEWSFRLLDDGEQSLFSRLAVFAGGCTLEAVEEVCDPDGELPFDVLEGLSSLVDKSLLGIEEPSAGDLQPRFVMLETIREYALERLMAGQEAEKLRRQHAAFVLRLVEDAEPHLVGAAQASWLTQLELELDNVRTALRWAVENREATIGLQIASGLWRFWYARGHLTEGRKWLAELAASDGAAKEAGAHSPLRVKAMIWGAGLAADQGDYRQATILAEDTMQLSRASAYTWGIAFSLSILGNVAHNQGDYVRAQALYEESLALFQELDNRWGIGLSLNNLGAVAQASGDLPRAAAQYEESLSIWRDTGDLWSIAVVLDNLGEVMQARGERGRATALHAESLALRRELGDTWGMADSLSALGLVSRSDGNYERAASLYEEGLSLYREVGDKWRSAVCLEGLAGIAQLQGWMDRAARLFGAASELRDSIGQPLTPAEHAAYDLDVAAVLAALGEEAFAAAWNAGRGMFRSAE